MRRLMAGFLFSLLAFVSIAGAQTASQNANLSDAMRFLQHHETRSNAAAIRSIAPVSIEHYEIPLDLIESKMDLRIDPKIARSLIFEKKGRKYIRWIINPEDTAWHLDIESFLQERGQSVEKKKYFTGYQTASRSYVIKDPVSGSEFSAKVSTNRSGGLWTDKKQTWEDAAQVRLVYEYLQEVVRKRGGLKNAILIDEPAAFGIKSIDQGMLIRTYDSLSAGDTKLIPGFSILHEQTGANIARINGSNDPERFWNKHYNKPLARALAEVYALTGMTFDSPHSQNFMVELDAYRRPTGRIALRDFGDAYLSKEVFEASGRADILPKWEQKNVLSEHLHVGVGFLHGNLDPSWLRTDSLTNVEYKSWGLEFFKEFEKEFRRMTGVNLSRKSERAFGKYFITEYSLLDEAGAKYLAWVEAGRPRSSSRARSCSAVFGRAM